MQPGAWTPGGNTPQPGYGQPGYGPGYGQPGYGPPGYGQPPYSGYATTGEPPAPQQDPLERAAQGAVTSFRKRLIDLSTMTWALRIITILGFAQLIAIGAALALRDVLPTQMIIDHQEGKDIQAPVIVFIVVMVGLGLVWATALTAALHSAWYLRFSALLFFTFWFLLELATGFPVGENPAARVNDTVLTVLVIQFAILLGVWLRAIAITLLNWRAGKTGISLNRERSIGPTFALLVVAMAVHYIAGYIASEAANNGTNDLNFQGLISIEVSAVFVLLLPVLFITGTDFAEAGQTISDSVANFLRRRGAPAVLFAITLLAALISSGYCAYYFLTDPSVADLHLFSSASALIQAVVGIAIVFLGFGVLVALVAWGLLKLTEVAFAIQRWPALEMPALAYLLATLVVGVAFGIVILLFVTGASLVVGLIVPILGFAVGLPLAFRGRQQPGRWSIAGVFLILVSTFGFVTYAGVYSGPLPLQVLVAPASLVALLWVAIRRGVNQSTIPFFAALLTLNVGIVAIAIFVSVFGLGQSTLQVGVIAAISLIGAFVWDLLTSGNRVTNVDGRRIRRYTRVLVYLAYTLFIATVAMFFATETFVSGGVPTIVHDLNGERIARLGLLFLGAPLIVTMFILRVSRWRASLLPR